MIEAVEFFMATMIVVITVGLTITICALCIMLIRIIYRDWDKI